MMAGLNLLPESVYSHPGKGARQWCFKYSFEVFYIFTCLVFSSEAFHSQWYMRLVLWETLETAAQQVCFITGLFTSLCTRHSSDPIDATGLCLSWLVNRAPHYRGSVGVRCCTELNIGTIQTREQAVFGWLKSDELNYSRVTQLLPKLASQSVLFDQDIQVPNLPVLLPYSLPVIICRILFTSGCINWMPPSLFSPWRLCQQYVSS